MNKNIYKNLYVSTVSKYVTFLLNNNSLFKKSRNGYVKIFAYRLHDKNFYSHANLNEKNYIIFVQIDDSIEGFIQT